MTTTTFSTVAEICELKGAYEVLASELGVSGNRLNLTRKNAEWFLEVGVYDRKITPLFLATYEMCQRMVELTNDMKPLKKRK